MGELTSAGIADASGQPASTRTAASLTFSSCSFVAFFTAPSASSPRARGISEEIATRLGDFPVLKVASRSSIEQLERTDAGELLDRARALSKRVRAQLTDVEFGIASITDRVLPHLFPTLGLNSFAATVDRAIEADLSDPEVRVAAMVAEGGIGSAERLSVTGPKAEDDGVGAGIQIFHLKL